MLPIEFVERMKQMLGEEYAAFEASYDKEKYQALRINTLKADKATFLEKASFSLSPVPWEENGYYYTAQDTPGKHPYHEAGVYYIQEPSAMAPVPFLEVKPGERVLDLCAAPGGKSTQIAVALEGRGLLVCNEIHPGRAKILSENIERMGVRNALVTNETPEKLEQIFAGYFDKILVDAPCSGEGMFRKSPAIMKNWEQYGVEYYQKLQREILPSAVKMLRPGGMLLYSTCTFSPEEDEDTLAFLLREYPELSMADSPLSYEGFAPGRPEWADGPEEIKKSIRIWPHRMEGEGHFVALLKKSEDAEGAPYTTERVRPAKLSEEAEAFLKRLGIKLAPERIIAREERLYYLPENLPDLSGLRILRSGLLLGEMKKNRFEPSQALACALKAEEYDNCYNLTADDEDVIRYLKCETIDAKCDVKDGFVLVCVDGYPLGWGKAAKGVIKNKYLAGWRMM